MSNKEEVDLFSELDFSEFEIDENLDDNDLLSITDGNQFLFFTLKDKTYAIDASLISEMVEYQGITKVPLVSKFIKGVTNIRGEIVCVVDLSLRFDMPSSKLTDRTTMIVVNRKSYLENGMTQKIALVVDMVDKVKYVEDGNIFPPLDLGTKIDKKYVLNMIKDNDRHIVLLNTNAILEHSEISKVVR
jgi:purine-binding chemotaxis protein CheW